jgi:hypothetical protein
MRPVTGTVPIIGTAARLRKALVAAMRATEAGLALAESVSRRRRTRSRCEPPSDLELFAHVRAREGLSSWERRFVMGVSAAICAGRELLAEQRSTLELIARQCGVRR